jgi:hypothetical protein
VWWLPLTSAIPSAAVKLNANRHVTGTLRGFDQFMNLVLDGTVDEKLKIDIGMVVSAYVCTISACLLPSAFVAVVTA